MREILFRGKRKDNGEWICGYYALRGIHLGTIEEEIYPTIAPFGNYPISYEVAPKTLGQFTGLTDKNGTKIFEGDIVEYNDGFDYFKGEVVFENGAFGIGCDEVIGISSGCSDNFANLWQLFWDQEVIDEPELYYCKVIGNIYDDPELLKGDAEEA